MAEHGPGGPGAVKGALHGKRGQDNRAQLERAADVLGRGPGGTTADSPGRFAQELLEMAESLPDARWEIDE